MRLLLSLLSFLTIHHIFGAQIPPGQLTQITSDTYATSKGPKFHLYVPRNLSKHPALVVAIHYCTGTGPAYFKNSPYGKLAEQYGFIAIYPTSPHNGTCWDLSSRKTLTHNGGSDSGDIVGMVKWLLGRYSEVDQKRVYMVGTSSGAMMVNVLAGAYPDLFAAGIAYSGVPAGCFVSQQDLVNAWNSTCAQGKAVTSPKEWATVVSSMNPGYQGPRPKMLIYHGSKDAAISPQNYEETTKQWSGVFGYDYGNGIKNAESDKYVSTTWGPNLMGMLAKDGTHDLKQLGNFDMAWFGLSAIPT
ncbi:putative acetyl xylan esterase [Tothia fuscella]|uniref:Carboxylic ester hydrolase n=1 Tax=Tothia fuscella TaxID=1048955 RepID=A0A9P4NXH7_9PEZI|nr:putative acetyl xylan esterase [Tothia fuscella]